MKFDKTKKRLCSIHGIFFIVALIVIAGICTPMMVIGAEFYISSASIVSELEQRLDEFQVIVDSWQAGGKNNFGNQEPKAFVSDKSFSEVYTENSFIPLKPSTTPNKFDEFVQNKSKVTYDVLRYTTEIDYPENPEEFNMTGILVNDQIPRSSGTPLVNYLNFSAADIVNNDYGRFNLNFNATVSNSTIIKICELRYFGVWNTRDDICQVTVYTTNLCFSSQEASNSGCYYNTIHFLYGNGYFRII
eukprot:NODE_4_length_77007_cov_1.156642.p46 type:complete len:246 gc:universal NODE_4_length_77007_cov_1.156642:2476-1739(-)